MTIDWEDPGARLALIQSVGIKAYNEAIKRHLAESVVEIVNGYDIAQIATRFGRLFEVRGSGAAFRTIEIAREFASKQPTKKVAMKTDAPIEQETENDKGWVIAHQTIFGNWEPSSYDDGKLEIFPTKGEADANLKDHLDSIREAVEDGHMSDYDPEAWRVQKA